MQVEVWEAGAEVGGWARSEIWGEGILEPGAQVLFRSPHSALDRLLTDLELPVDSLAGKRWMTQGDRAHVLPGRSSQWLSSPLLSPLGKARVGWGLRPWASSPPKPTLAAAGAERFGKAFARDLLPALAAGLFAAPPHLLSGALLPALMGRSEGELVRPRGGMGAFAQALARGLTVRLNHPALRLEALSSQGVRVMGPSGVSEARRLLLALPGGPAASLMDPMAPGVAESLRALRYLDVSFRHSRHAPCPTLGEGWGLLCDPARERGLLGFTVVPGPKGVRQIRCGFGGAYPVADELMAADGIQPRLKAWFPELAPATETRWTVATQAMPLLDGEHSARVAAILAGLPPAIAWIGAGRFPGGIPGIIGGLERGAV